MTDLSLPYFVARAAEPTGRGVIVIHEGLGLTTQILRFAEHLASEGYTVVAPDLFFRTGGPRDEDWWTSINAITDDDLRDDLTTCIDALHGLGATSIGITGFCLGGRVSYVAAKWADQLGIDASVSYYGQVDKELGELRCPTIMLFGGQDEYIERERVATVEAYHPGLVHVYEGNGHAFMRDGDEEAYDPATAGDAWARMTDHFGKHLTPK